MPKKENAAKEIKSIADGKPPRTRSSGSKWIGILIILLLISLIGLFWSFYKYQTTKKQIAVLSAQTGQAQLSDQEIDELLGKVSRHILLPSEEKPTVATIVNAAVLAEQQDFYRDAQNGDRLLIYKNKAIIYDPDNDIIVNVGPVIIQNSGQPASGDIPVAPAVDGRVSVELRNGTETRGLTRTRAPEFDANLYNIINITTAGRTDYVENIVVNLKGAEVGALADQFGAAVVDVLPEGEADSTADAVVIFGQEQYGNENTNQ
ncbi:MAG: hypothetical protein WC618_06130 [Patescibacteria group bacterium]